MGCDRYGSSDDLAALGRRLRRHQHALVPHAPILRHDQYVARGVRHHLADHLADQQVGQKAPFSPTPDDDQLRTLFLRFINDLAVGLFTTPYA